MCSNNPFASWCFMHFISTTSVREHSKPSFLSGFQFHPPPVWAPRSNHGDFWQVQKCSLLKCNSVSQQLSSFPPASLCTTSFASCPRVSSRNTSLVIFLSAELGVFPLSGGLVLVPCSSACKHRLIPELPKTRTIFYVCMIQTSHRTQRRAGAQPKWLSRQWRRRWLLCKKPATFQGNKLETSVRQHKKWVEKPCFFVLVLKMVYKNVHQQPHTSPKPQWPTIIQWINVLGLFKQ